MVAPQRNGQPGVPNASSAGAFGAFPRVRSPNKDQPRGRRAAQASVAENDSPISPSLSIPTASATRAGVPTNDQSRLTPVDCRKPARHRSPRSRDNLEDELDAAIGHDPAGHRPHPGGRAVHLDPRGPRLRRRRHAPQHHHRDEVHPPAPQHDLEEQAGDREGEEEVGGRRGSGGSRGRRGQRRRRVGAEGERRGRLPPRRGRTARAGPGQPLRGVDTLDAPVELRPDAQRHTRHGDAGRWHGREAAGRQPRRGRAV
ncbi:hypothetical protein THAOC_02033 [Thalassiosira oceanica]|uniref:Uncharacterized protein n=1 Tax=Thalassiosira oceanica TaxID=159749 RepID=K0TGV7_THAOC|nr:hypothetical protein THAOC_02033 [Thalassiosira oceanica]|eukprot:EJK76219.1 hypothetical protein THAOC_02033 [Thalassiosira oceanica]